MTAKSKTCSICQCEIEAGEDTTKCNRCGLPFHLDCWNENLGCSAYGCPNVNLLKGGPDITIRNPPAVAGVPSWPSQARNVNATAPHPAVAATDEFPWEYLLLASCALASLLGALFYGILSLIVGVGCIAYAVANANRARMGVISACFIVAGLGFIFGIVLSIRFWW